MEAKYPRAEGEVQTGLRPRYLPLGLGGWAESAGVVPEAYNYFPGELRGALRYCQLVSNWEKCLPRQVKGGKRYLT